MQLGGNFLYLEAFNPFFMRKILLVSTLILLLSGCSLWNKETNFTSLYSAYVVAPIDTLENFAQYVGYNRQEEITGALK